MNHEQKTALARIISDMIKADNIIDESEIINMKKLMESYSLSQKDMNDARNIRFSEAANTLRQLSIKERRDFFDKIYNVALSDRVCVPREALLLLALNYIILEPEKYAHDNKRNRPFLLSCVTNEASFNDQYIVYIESSYNNELNLEIQNKFRLLVATTRMCGFNLIYIPKMVEEFRSMDKQYVLDVISYMAPNLEGNSIKEVYDNLCCLTTEEFFQRVLIERLQVKTPSDMPPSLLINIGTSIVPYVYGGGKVQYFTEFLCLPISTNILSMVDDILDFYQTKVNVQQTIKLNDGKGQFKYFGFYKALFDFLVAPPPVAPDLVFLGQTNAGRYQIAFKFGENNEKKISLTPKEYEAYYNIAEKTYKCNNRSKGLPIGDDRGLQSTVAHIKRKIAEEVPDLTYSYQYKPERDGNAYIIRLKSDMVFVRSYDYYNGTHSDIPIKECNKQS